MECWHGERAKRRKRARTRLKLHSMGRFEHTVARCFGRWVFYSSFCLDPVLYPTLGTILLACLPSVNCMLRFFSFFFLLEVAPLEFSDLQRASFFDAPMDFHCSFSHPKCATSCIVGLYLRYLMEVDKFSKGRFPHPSAHPQGTLRK